MMGKEAISGEVESAIGAIKKRNEQVALSLSLTHNHPDDKGRTRIEQERNRLNKSSPDSWERTRNPLRLGQEVLILTGTPVGLLLEESYITGIELKGILIGVYGLYGGTGYGQRGTRLVEPLSKVSVKLPQIEGEVLKTFTLLVPCDMYYAAPQAPADSHSVAA